MASNGISRPGDATVAGLADRTTGLVGWTIAWRATSAVATLALGAFLIRQLSPSEYGRYTFVLSVLVYIALLATFGQDQGLLRYLPEVIGRGDRAAAHDLLRKSAIAIFAVWALAVAYFVILMRRINRAGGIPGDRIGWRRLLVYASGWLPSLLIASAVGLQFESLFLLRFSGPTTVAFYDTGYNIPQRLVALIPSLLTGAWVVGTLEGWRRESQRVRASVMAFYKGIFLVACPLLVAGGAMLGPLIRLLYTNRLAPAALIAPVMLGFFVLALLVTPWGLVVRG